MMEMLTLSPAPMPAAITPAAPDGGEAVAATVDFSALLGTAQLTPPVAPVALPVAEGEATLAMDAEPAVIAPIEAVAVALAPTPEAPVEPETPADPAATAIVAGVNLPTLPKDFVAQKPTKAAKPVTEEADDEPSADDSDAPSAPAVCAALPPIVTPVEAAQAPADATVAAEILTATSPKAPASEPIQAPKPEAAPQPQPAAPVVVADAIAAALPKPRDEQPARELAVAEKPVAAVERAAPVAVEPLAAPAAPQQQPAQAQPPVAGIAQQSTVVLDDLFVAGAADSAWIDRLATDITTLASGDQREARMKLTPRILGDMGVRLEMDGRHTRVHFTVETQQAQQMIADSAQRLSSLVEANGLKLDGTTVDLDQRRSGGEPDRRAQTAEQFETQRGTRANRDSGIAQAVARTRLATATERFA